MRHNLGGRRTINMPTVPLEMLGARNHPRFLFKRRSGERVRGVATVRLEFEEIRAPTLVHAADGRNMWTHRSAWVDPATASLHRVAISVGPDAFRRVQAESQMRVEFARENTLDLLVPTELVENFWIRNGHGDGRAGYSNFRRYTTSARILPP